MKKLLITTTLMSVFTFTNANTSVDQTTINGSRIKVGDSTNSVASRLNRPIPVDQATINGFRVRIGDSTNSVISLLKRPPLERIHDSIIKIDGVETLERRFLYINEIWSYQLTSRNHKIVNIMAWRTRESDKGKKISSSSLLDLRNSKAFFS